MVPRENLLCTLCNIALIHKLYTSVYFLHLSNIAHIFMLYTGVYLRVVVYLLHLVHVAVLNNAHCQPIKSIKHCLA